MKRRLSKHTRDGDDVLVLDSLGGKLDHNVVNFANLVDDSTLTSDDFRVELRRNGQRHLKISYCFVLD